MSAGVIALLLVLGAAPFGVGLFYHLRKPPAEPSAFLRLKEIESAGAQKMREEFDRTGEVSEKTSDEFFAAYKRGMLTSARELGGDAKLMEVAVNWMDESEAMMKRALPAKERFLQMQPLNVQLIRTLDDLRARRQTTQDLLKAEGAMLAVMESMPDRLRFRLQQAGVNSKMAQGFVEGSAKVFQIKMPLWRKVLEYDRAFAERLLEIYHLLEKDWGHWRVQRGTLKFESAASANQFNDLFRRAMQATQAEELVESEALAPLK